MDGYDATRAMRAWEQKYNHPPVPILALTADAFKEALDQSMAAGCNAHLTKPIAKAVLVDAIRRHALPCSHQAPVPAKQLETEVTKSPGLSKLAPRYLKNMGKELEALRLAEAEEDYATIQRIGHNLHGTGGSFGFPMITEFGSQMEQAAKDRVMSKARSAIVQLDIYLERVTAAKH